MKSSDTRTRRRGDTAGNRESGYALLLIFAMAAAVAVMLYIELPRLAFEAQREQEQTLIDRGEQYKRAIQLYFRKFKNYPASLEALENTNNVRFLRRRYLDPLTGKDEWRLIHVGPGGVFTDSLTRKQKQDQKPEENRNTFITEGPGIGSTLPEAQRGAAGPPRRPSEGGPLQPGSDTGGTGTVPGQTPLGQLPGLPGIPVTSGDPSQQGQAPGQMPQSAPPLPGLPSISSPIGVQSGMPAQPVTDPPQPGWNVPINSGANANQQPGMNPTYPGANTGSQQGMTPADLIGNLLRQPRPMPQSGLPGMAGGGMAITGGIAGVASKIEKPSIKIYGDRQQYNEWEFIYDFTKDRTGAGRMAGMMRAGQQQGALGAPGVGQPSAFGVQPGVAGGQGGFGGQSIFGQQAGAASGFGNTGAPSGSGSSSGGVGSGFGGSVGSGFGAPSSPTTGQPPAQQPPSPSQQPAQPTPQPGPIAPPPPPPPANPPPQQ
jgi:hypothetical protein